MEVDSAAPGDAAVVRILDVTGRPVGSGFLIGPGEVLTCAHVAAQALGAPPDTEDLPAGRLRLDFPLADPGREIEASIADWTPVKPGGSGDVAVLRLLSEPPEKAPVARLVDDVAGPDRRVRTFGFPAGYDDGVWSVGWLRGRQGADWFQYDTDPAAQHRIRPGFSGAPVWDSDTGGVVGMVVAADRAADVRTGYLIPTRVLRASRPSLGDAALGANPFRSLDHFHERDAALFHGREDPARRIVDRLGHAPATCLVGPSGSGKSSLLFAGVLPLLRGSGPGGHRLRTVVMRPGRPGPSPLTPLALTLLPLLEPDLTETARLAERPRLERLLGDGGMPAVVERLLERQGKDRLLLVADQFEETLVGPARADLAPFARALAHCLEPGSRLQVLLGLRADFLTAALDQPELAPLLAGDRLFTLVAMSDAELRAAIVRPLERTGVSYEPGLVDRILQDIGRDPGRLPLLQFTLTRLWERQERGVIGHPAYEALGRVDDALANYAEQVWTAWLTRDEQRAARALLTQLVHPAEGRTAPARRTVRRSELQPERWRIAQRLMTTRLVVPGADHLPEDGPPEETVELAHETLLAQWARLKEYVAADHDFRAWQEDLRRRTTLWERAGRPRRRLLHGADLRDAHRWLSRRPGELSPADEEFVAASGRAGRRRLAGRGMAAVVAFVTVLTAFLVSGNPQDPSEELAASVARELRLRAEDEAEDSSGNMYTALLLAMRAYRTHYTKGTREMLGQMHARYGFADLLVPDYPTDARPHEAWSPAYAVDRRGRVIASQTADGTAAVWQRDGSGHHRRSLRHSGGVTGISPDGSVVALRPALAATSSTGAPRAAHVHLYDVRARKTRRVDQPAIEPGSIRYGLVFAPDHEQLMGQYADGVFQWNTANGAFRQVSFTDREETVVGANRDGLVTWSTSSGLTAATAIEVEVTHRFSLWDLDAATSKPRRTHTFQYVDNGLEKPFAFDVSPDLTRLAIAESVQETPDSEWRTTTVTVYDVSSGRVEWRDRFAAEAGPDHIAVGDQGRPTLLYSSRHSALPWEAAAQAAHIAAHWTAMDLLGTPAKPVWVLQHRGVIALVDARAGDPAEALPTESEHVPMSARRPSPDASASASASADERREAEAWMADLCRILGDERLPPEQHLPPGAYKGPLCP
ncbi:trypsin-like peptidase domain-containing protein [Streptomyces sp. ISL-22]|nr:trypsin-like peptidase domain-containing protein [Streptomyces sp. ISL-22]MBT2419644.1 trypsin-like peptidase domain-containing protein [Streptomyces sp. ISL-24]MBT2436409.1 trypsin-like peptidase domain-containing protein [Streptomyces sp. ISL-22]